jgi:hypothetical protein
VKYEDQVGGWFATLTQKQIRHGTHRSTQQLEQAIREYLATYNADPKHFVWSKTADEIFRRHPAVLFTNL